jgi:hypothetical protein
VKTEIDSMARVVIEAETVSDLGMEYDIGNP